MIRNKMAWLYLKNLELLRLDLTRSSDRFIIRLNRAL